MKYLLIFLALSAPTLYADTYQGKNAKVELVRQFKPVMARQCRPEVALPFAAPMALIIPVGLLALLSIGTVPLFSTLVATGTLLIGVVTNTAIGTADVAIGESQAVDMSLSW